MFAKLKHEITETAFYSRNREILGILCRAIAIIAYLGVFTWIGRRFEDFQIAWLDPVKREYAYQAVATVAIFAIGFGLFLFRSRWREQYGWMEVAFALVTAFFSVGRLLNSSADRAYDVPINLLAVTASIYLVVRGFDNKRRTGRRHKEWDREPVRGFKRSWP